MENQIKINNFNRKKLLNKIITKIISITLIILTLIIKIVTIKTVSFKVIWGIHKKYIQTIWLSIITQIKNRLTTFLEETKFIQAKLHKQISLTRIIFYIKSINIDFRPGSSL